MIAQDKTEVKVIFFRDKRKYSWQTIFGQKETSLFFMKIWIDQIIKLLFYAPVKKSGGRVVKA